MENTQKTQESKEQYDDIDRYFNLEDNFSQAYEMNNYAMPEDRDQIDYDFYDYSMIAECNTDENSNVNTSIDAYTNLNAHANISTNTNASKNTKSCPITHSKKIIQLSPVAEQFKFSFYFLFSKSKKKAFDKETIGKIHKYISKYCNVAKITREEKRSINLYFQNHVNESEIILTTISNHKNEIMQAIPSLQKLN